MALICLGMGNIISTILGSHMRLLTSPHAHVSNSA